MLPPYGGTLVNLCVSASETPILSKKAYSLAQLRLTERALCDLEVLATGGFSPLTTFMGEQDYKNVVENMRLKNGMLWPMPITLPIDPSQGFRESMEVALTDENGQAIAIMTLLEIYTYDPMTEAQKVFGTTDESHPGVAALVKQPKFYASGPIQLFKMPAYYDFPALRRTPSEVREELDKRQWKRIVAFQTRNPLHRAHEELTKRAAQQIEGGLLLHPVVGMTKPGDVDHYTRVLCYQALVKHHYKANEVFLSLLPLAMRMGGPKEAIWHAIIRRNYGATHFIVGRDHAGPGKDKQGKPFYGPYDAQELMQKHETELGVKMVPFQMVVYLPDKDTYVPLDQVPQGEKTADISGTQVRDEYLATGKPLPAWFTRPEIAEVLAHAHPPTHKQGFVLAITGKNPHEKHFCALALEQMLSAHGKNVSLIEDQTLTHSTQLIQHILLHQGIAVVTVDGINMGACNATPKTYFDVKLAEQVNVSDIVLNLKNALLNERLIISE